MALNNISKLSNFYEISGIMITIMLKLCNYCITGKKHIISKNNLIESICSVIIVMFIISFLKRFKMVKNNQKNETTENNLKTTF